MIIDLLFKTFFKNTIYIKFSSENLYIRYAERNKTIEEKPIIAISINKGKSKVIAVGRESNVAKSKNPQTIKVCNGFKHPRTFVSDFEVAEATLRYFICKIVQRKIMLRPLIIFHPTEKTDGGVTQIEYRGLMELGASIGGRNTYVWTGHTLTNREILDQAFLEKNCLDTPSCVNKNNTI